MRVALIHDYLIQYGGAERVLEEFTKIFPNAPIFTLIYDAKATGYAFQDANIRTSFLQNIPKPSYSYRFFPLFMPMAIESFDLNKYDLVISSSASFAKGVIMRNGGLHISYCHSPMRYAWNDYKKFTGDSMYPSLIAKTIPFFMPYMRLWDRSSANRPDYYISNSNFIKKKIKKFYNRDAYVIYPPLNFEKFYIDKPKDYFLVVARMVSYKKINIAIETFNKIKLPLKIIGTGPEYKKLKKMAGSTIEFLGLISEFELPKYYAQAQALIFPQEEDFGITALESMASGRPVIAYRRGGVLETVEEDKTGFLFDEQNHQFLKDAVMRFKHAEIDSKYIRESVHRFDKLNFRRQIIKFVQEKLEEENKLIRT